MLGFGLDFPVLDAAALKGLRRSHGFEANPFTVAEAREQEPDLSLNAAVKRSGPRVGINTDSLLGWCKQADVDAGRAAGTTMGDAARLRELERENREHKRASEILLAASSFFARELDPRRPW